VLEAEERVLSNRHDASVAPSNTGVPAAEIDEEDETPDKRRRDDDVSGAQSNAGEAAEMDEGEDEDETPNKRLRYGAAVPPRVAPEQIKQQTYWESSEAMKLFFPSEDDASVMECLQRRILLISSVGASVDGWRLVVDGGDPDDLCSPNDIF
jgi:hypothetical protein